MPRPVLDTRNALKTTSRPLCSRRARPRLPLRTQGSQFLAKLAHSRVNQEQVSAHERSARHQQTLVILAVLLKTDTDSIYVNSLDTVFMFASS